MRCSMIAPPKTDSNCTDCKCQQPTIGLLWKGLAVVVVIAIASVVFFFSRKDNNVQPEISDDARTTALKEVQPTKSRASSQDTALPRSTTKDIATVENEQQKAAPKSNSPWANKPPRVIKHRESDKKPRRFVYDSEELIANLLEIEPGTLMFGELPYGKRFNEDFKQAIMQKVKINPEDDEYTKELKRQVQAVKDDFKQILIDGGDVGEEMRKARNELKELGMFKESLRRELFELRKSGEYSSDDMKDFITAANKMLEAKGLQPLKVPRVFLRNLELKEGKTK